MIGLVEWEAGRAARGWFARAAWLQRSGSEYLPSRVESWFETRFYFGTSSYVVQK